MICKGEFQVTDKNVSVKREMTQLTGKIIGSFQTARIDMYLLR